MAFKIPRVDSGLGIFLTGFLGNLCEIDRWSRSHHPRLGRVLAHFAWGFVLVMTRYDTFCVDLIDPELDFPVRNPDLKPENVAIDNGLQVLVDYGNQDMHLRD